MKRVKQFFKDDRHFVLFFTLLYVAVSLFLIFTHEQIFDESNPWQIAKIITPGNFFEVMRVEPHAPLWYLILAPFAKLGLPLITTNFVSLAIMALTVYLFLKHAPFRRTPKLLFLLSAGFFYFFPVISRDYCLVPLALTLLTIIYPTRLEHPVKYTLILALLVQSHFLMAGLAAALALLYLVDYIKNHRKDKKVSPGLRPLIIGFIVLALSAVSLLPSAIGSFADHRLVAHSHEVALTYADYSTELNSALFYIFVPIFEIAITLILIYLIINYRRLAFLLAAYLAVFFVATFIFYKNFVNFPLKTATIISVLIFIYWLTFLEKKHILKRPQKLFHKIELVRFLSLKNALAPLLFVVPISCTIPFTVGSAAYDVFNLYDKGIYKEFIKTLETTEDDAIIVMDGQEYVRNVFYIYIASIPKGRVLYDAYSDAPMEYVAYDKNEIDFQGFDGLADQLLEISEKYNTKNIYLVTIQGQTSCGDPTHVPLNDTWEYAFTLEVLNNAHNLDAFKINFDKYETL